MVITIGDLAKSDPRLLKSKLGINGIYLWRYANGMDESKVEDLNYFPPIKSIGRGITCTSDLINNVEVYRIFQELSFGVSKSLRENGLAASGIQISIKDNGLFTKQYQAKVTYKTLSSTILCKEAYKLFLERYDWKRSVRALTIRAINLVSRENSNQINFFDDYSVFQKKEKIDETFFAIRDRFGRTSITYGGLMQDIKMPKERNEIITLPGGIRSY
jgi:DNA polymerase-4